VKKLIVAVGGNAILPAGDPGDATGQLRRLAETSSKLADLVAAGYDLIVTHGNGPQVGNILLQNEESRQKVPAMPLDVCVAESQAQIGYLFQQALANEFAARRISKVVACVVTQVLVDPSDPAFGMPTKPIGPYYAREDELVLKRAKGWKMVYDPRGGYRRVVPSPRPVDVVEKDVLVRLVNQGDGRVIIAVGGGGIPVIRKEGRLVGVEAVIDKDLASAVLARSIGASRLVMLTGEPFVFLDYRKPTQRPLPLLAAEEARRYLGEGQFPPGSMGPKIEAALEFLAGGGAEALITSIEGFTPALEGTMGTRIV